MRFDGERVIAGVLLAGGLLFGWRGCVVTDKEMLSMAQWIAPLEAVHVIDGDTFDMCEVKPCARVRLFGIDAPEKDQPLGLSSLVELDGLVHGRAASCCGSTRQSADKISCVPADRDRYGRIVATCYRGETDLGRELVRAGLAVAYTAYTSRYTEDEYEARLAGRGLWAIPNYTMPAEWRAQHRRSRP